MKEIQIVYPQPNGAFKKVCKTESIFFEFEDDFLADNMRCIPMIARFKLDACGIKLKLNEWGKMTVEERNILITMPCSTQKEILRYRSYLQQLVFSRTGKNASGLEVEQNPAWANTNALCGSLLEKLEEFNWFISTPQWCALSNLQRFVLIKLCRPGHENENFPKAVKEFGLI